MRNYIYRVLVAWDMAANVTFFNGYDDETISAHAGRMRKRDGWAKGLSWILDKIQKKHVEGAILGDKQRAEVVTDVEAQAENQGLTK